ncbi:MAG: hypothetical protein HUU23_14620 [Caldilineales bacterium]|nr:hypothetical protein [Caldilineales bacterium]
MRPCLSRSSLLFLALLLLSVLLSAGFPAVTAAPFQSPTPEHVIHQPLIIKGSGEMAVITLDLEADGLPVALVLAALLLLSVPAAAFVAVRRRHR